MIMAIEISERTLGQLPLSIATSLAIETIIGIHPENKVTKLPILEYNQLWINLKTLFRNFEGALHKESSTTTKETADGLLEEIDKIKEIISEYSNGKTKVIFYVSNYKDMESAYKHASIRGDTTVLQKDMTDRYKKSIGYVLKTHEHDPDFRVFDRKLKGDKLSDVLILTHIPYDLISYREFHKLVLLESHTGKLKEKSLWYTKYLNGSNLAIIPFREDLLQVFGDKETFKPMNIDVRNDIIALAEKYRWSSATTTDKIRYGINTLLNPYAKEILNKILIT